MLRDLKKQGFSIKIESKNEVSMAGQLKNLICSDRAYFNLNLRIIIHNNRYWDVASNKYGSEGISNLWPFSFTCTFWHTFLKARQKVTITLKRFKPIAL